MNIFIGIMIPFIGTTAGAACVYFLRQGMRQVVQKGLLGFASGVMIAASVWSLLIPAMDMSEGMGKLAFIPAAVGFCLGIGFLLALDRLIPHLHLDAEEPEGPSGNWKKSTMLVLAVTLHNIPEGMAVGVAFGAAAGGDPLAAASGAGMAGAVTLMFGIGLQNLPEGMAVSVPLLREGFSRRKAFFYGQLSGIVEPVAAVLGAVVAASAESALPYALAFAAGAMIFVVVEEVVPEAQASGHGDAATLGVMVGFVVMMCLDVGFG